MHFTYESSSLDALMQGDVLARTPDVDEVLMQVHPHFHAHPKNTHFIVLTQSCDLAVRTAGGRCKAPYITIAPVRTLDLVIERFLGQEGAAPINAELPVLGQRAKSKASEFLQRLFNNNVPGYFYLAAEGAALPHDSVAFLDLSIAIKADLHFGKCLSAKLLQLSAEFQAKLGWLVGHVFSRVGTQDWDDAELRKKVNKQLEEIAIWIPDSAVTTLAQSLGATAAGGRIVSRDEVSAAIRKMPNKKQKVLDEIDRVVGDVLPGSADGVLLAQKLRKRLESDMSLTALLK